MKNTIMLKKNYEFKKVLTKGKYYSGRKIEAFILKNGSDKKFLGLAIGVKRGKSTMRNKIKRLLRENYSNLENNIKDGNSIVFLCKKQTIIKDINYYDIENDMIYILKKAEIL